MSNLIHLFGIHHIAIIVSNYERVKDFYVKKLDLISSGKITDLNAETGWIAVGIA